VLDKLGMQNIYAPTWGGSVEDCYSYQKIVIVIF
jgi:hypothetical protein